MIRFHILGAGGALPTPTHNPPAYWVTVDGHSVLMDPGPGALVRLVQSGQAPRGVDDIDRVFFTHLHPDHCADLVPLLFALHSPVPVRTDPVRLFGPPGLAAYLEKLREIYGTWLEPRLRALEVTEIGPGVTVPLPDGGSVRPFAVNHDQDRLSRICLGYRFSDAAGGTAVFSGDTGPCPELNKAAAGTDLLVVECSTPDHLATPGHMCVADVGRLCAEARPGQVALTHQYPDAAALDLAALVGKHYDGPVHQAVDGSVFFVPHDPGEESP
ncbi:MAG: ribonuclease Z [Candidatus Krumholzibacteriota bacterium]